jgi:isopentenyl diphosphate isomerase/L-lactate dehydrogenase-like FMN-dependent dehydrogenase
MQKTFVPEELFMTEHNAGDSERITREYFDSLLLEMRHIDSVEPSTELTLFGKTFATPIMMAALSNLDSRTRAGGMALAAQAFASCGALAWAGVGDDAELAAMRATGAEVVKIIKPFKDNDEIFRQIELAHKLGCLAVGVDVDHQFGSKNSWYTFGTGKWPPVAPKSFDEIRSFVKASKLPFIVKGVLSEQDTYKCLDAGVGGIVVSHHHGMVDYSLPPLQVLPRIVRIVRGQIPIFVDCGIKRGLDAFKALALGANAVAIGRVIMPPLAEEGAEGVAALIEQMTHELKWAMAVTCSPAVGRIDPAVIWHK